MIRKNKIKNEGKRKIMKIEKNILSITEQYDTLFVDVYGVLYNGLSLYSNTLETMEELRKLGKKIIILSNTTQVSEDAKHGYEQRGMYSDIHYDKVITSGEYLHYILISQSQEISKSLGKEISSVKCLFMGNASIFADSQIIKTESFDYADLMYVGVPRGSYGRVRIDDLLDENNDPVKIEDVVHCDWHKLHNQAGRRGPSEFATVLERCLEKNKILLVANPDIFAHESDSNRQIAPVFAQGILGKYYEKLGGKVLYFGKPYTGIFEFAKQFAESESKNKILMVGDTPWTDILGANNSGIDSAMVMTGVSGEFLKDEKIPLEQRLNTLYGEVSYRISGLEGSNRPMYILEKFAK